MVRNSAAPVFQNGSKVEPFWLHVFFSVPLKSGTFRRKICLCFLLCFVIISLSRVQFVKILDLKQKIYFKRPLIIVLGDSIDIY